METKEMVRQLVKCMFPRIYGDTLLPRVDCIHKGEGRWINCLFPRLKCIWKVLWDWSGAKEIEKEE